MARQTVSLPYGFTLFSNANILTSAHHLFHYLMDLHYSQTEQSYCCRFFRFHYLMDLHYSQTCFVKNPSVASFHYLMDLHYSQTKRFGFDTLSKFHYLMDLHYSQTGKSLAAPRIGFTTLWIYTILKPQISCAHYTAQGKSTRSSTIVLWRNEIVKGAQIPIQHIEFGAHIYAHRRLAL